MESYNFPKDITQEAFKLYKKYYEITRNTLNEDEILEKMKLNKKLGRRGLKNVTDMLKIKDGSW